MKTAGGKTVGVADSLRPSLGRVHAWPFVPNHVRLSCPFATDNLRPIDGSALPGSINIPEHPRAVMNP